MKRHINVTLRPSGNSGDVREAIRLFASKYKSWKLVRFISTPNENAGGADVVLEYQRRTGDPVRLGFVSSMQRMKDRPSPLGQDRSPLQRKPRPETLRLLTVIFQTGRDHGMPETNGAVQQFLEDFRACIRKERLRIRVIATNEDGGLSAVIPAAHARRVFELFLSQYPLSGHPSDEERLNFFICTAFRYRADVSGDEIGKYLVEDLKWSDSDAARVASRIWNGLELLRVNQRFGGLQRDYFHERRL